MAPHITPQTVSDEFPAKLTSQVVFCSLIAAFGGLMFGYDVGISGGVTSMDEFLTKFFPSVYQKKHRAKENNYCKFDNQLLQLFTSSLYLAAVVCCWLASFTCRRFGRKRTMQMSATFFLTGVALTSAALNLYMLIAGRIFLGAGIGFGNHAIPLFISELAPARYRGGLNVCFQLLVTVGILIANVVNYFTSKMGQRGWRLSLGLAGFPALFLGLGTLLIIETPTSLIERGKPHEGLTALRKSRGTEDVQKEYDEIVHATDIAGQIKHPFRNLMTLSNVPLVFCSMILQVFQQFTGINVIMFYMPLLFQMMGLGASASLMSSVVMGTVNVLSTLVAVFGVDKFGRRKLLIQAAIQMFIAQVISGVILYKNLHETGSIGKSYAYLMVVLVCLFVSGFAWSWGPLGWLIPSEIFPLETRPAGFFFAVSTNMIFTFIIAQAFLTMLCHMKALTFFFFAVWIVVMGNFAFWLLPETKGIPINEMNERVWKTHWFWHRFFPAKGVAAKC